MMTPGQASSWRSAPPGSRPPGLADDLREALEHAPESRALLRAVAAGSGPDTTSERAELLARLLTVEEEERAPSLALELAGLWEHLGEAG